MADNRRVLSRRDVLARAGGLSIAGAMVSTVAPAVEARRLASAPEGGEQRPSRSPPRKSPKPSKEPTALTGASAGMTSVRWRFVPRDGEMQLSDAQMHSKPGDFLNEALIERTRRGRIRPSDDPILLFRSPSYALSFTRRIRNL
jgi:hypothetical protein